MKKVDQNEQHNTLVASVSTHDDKRYYKTERMNITGKRRVMLRQEL